MKKTKDDKNMDNLQNLAFFCIAAVIQAFNCLLQNQVHTHCRWNASENFYTFDDIVLDASYKVQGVAEARVSFLISCGLIKDGSALDHHAVQWREGDA